jgi:two-component system cell cycle response regulator
VCRYGGEEFAIVAPATSRRSAAQLAEDVRSAIADVPVALSMPGPVPSVSVTISAGVAIFEPGPATGLTTAELLVQAADKSLYAAKASGRNCVRVFNDRSAAQVAA